MPDRRDLKHPEPIERFTALLPAALPGSRVDIDRPADPNGEWWLDIARGDFETNVAWRPGLGFGVFLPLEPGLGDRPDETYEAPELAVQRLKQLVRRHEQSTNSSGLSFAELRALRDTRQQALAAVLESSQGAISRFENREDMRLSSLRAYVRAMGGELELRVRFDGFEAPLEVAGAKEESE